MAKKHRVRARSRRAVEAARRASAPRVTTYEREPTRAAVARPQRYGSRSGTSRAAGAPSAALERAASWERGYVVKDFRRIAIVIVIALALLVASGVILNFFER
ncbi:MAG: hypothetical protein E6J09_04255 [Chloroflexi bacterium]|nr:MAG: hypothetical protein E6J09_04255 [Chloroflexota bacterium]